MNLSLFHRSLMQAALVAALAMGSGCNVPPDPEAEEEEALAIDPPPKVSTIATPLNYEWLDLLYEMETEAEDLKGLLAKYLEFHEEYDFDAFLNLDASTVDKDVLFYLYHFSKNHYFTAEREALVALLERQVEHEEDPYWAFDAGVRQPLQERLTAATLFREQQIGDLQAVVEIYRNSQDTEFVVPIDIAPEELERMRELVAGVLAMERKRIALLEGRINELSEQLQ